MLALPRSAEMIFFPMAHKPLPAVEKKMNQQKHRESDGRVHILFFIPSLGGGGAEMHFLRVINHLDRKKFRLSLALGRAGGTYESALAKDVKVHVLNTGRINSSTLRMIRAIGPLHKILQSEQPNIICSALDHANTVAILASRSVQPQGPKIVISVQNPPSIRYGRSWQITSRLLLSLIERVYPQADRVIALSQGVAEDLLTLIPKIRDRTEVIYNAGLDLRVLNGASELPKEELPRNGPLLVACGRLTEQKGFPHLLEALARVRRITPAYLWIIGEGKQRQYLENKIQELGLTNCVRLLGFQNNPYKYMAAADVFVLSSLFEGFGNVIVEAMACGAPVVATDCPYGPREIIENGVSGLLVPPANVEALSEAIIRVLKDRELKHKLSQNGKERSQDFNAKAIAIAYGELFEHVACGQGD